MERLAEEITRVALPARGLIGIAAAELGNGWRFAMNADQRLPMASTFKVAVAAMLLAEADAGRARLDALVAVDPARLILDPPLADENAYDPEGEPLGRLMARMLIDSDNGATNVIMDLLGGPRATTAWLGAQGIEGISIDGDTIAIISRFLAIEARAGAAPNVLLRDTVAADPGLIENSWGATPHFDADPRDSATPAAMCQLLDRIADGTLLTLASTTLLLDTMAKCRTGDARIRAGLPQGTPISNKTGTIGSTANDIAIVALPGGRRLAMAIMVGRSDAANAIREAAIAAIARALYDDRVAATG